MGSIARPTFAGWSIHAANDPTALDRYREGLSEWYCASEFDEEGLPRFFTDNIVYQFGGYVVGRGRSIGQTLVRSPREIKLSGLDGVILLLDLGGMNGDVDGVRVDGRPGTVHIRHLSRPSAARAATVDAITIGLPRDAAPPWLLEPRFHGAWIDDGAPMGRVLINHMIALARTAPQLDLDEGVAFVRAALTLAENAFIGSGRFGPDQKRALYAGLRTAATALIDRRLGDPEFGVAGMVRALGVSRATLFRAFAADGGINVQIRRRRLHNARRVLLARTGRQPTVAEIAHAHGFVSESHFSRLFRAAYGEAPGSVGSRRFDPDRQQQGEDIRYDLVLGWFKGRTDEGTKQADSEIS